MTKATHKKTTIDIIKQHKKAEKKQAGQGRQMASGVSAASAGTQSLVQSSQSSSAGNNSSGALLTAGGTMIGPIAFYPRAVMISSDTIDISSTTDTGFSSRVTITGQTTADDLKQIDGASNAGQILFLQSITGQTITLKHHTGSAGGGNINIPGGADHVMGAQDIVLLQWDTINAAYTNSGGQWTLVSSSGSGANTSLSNLSNVAVNTDIDMGTYDITNLCRLEFDPAGSTLANTTAGIDATADEMHFNVPVGDDFKFTVNGTEEFVFKSNELDVKENDICNVGTIFTDYIAVSSGNTMIKSVGHFDPFGGDTYDLGDGTNYWRHLYISGDIHFKDGDDAEIKKLSTGLEYEVATDDYHRFQVNNVTKFQVGATSCSMDGGMIIGSADGVEIGYKVDNQALTVGSKGSMIHPYLESTTNHSTGSNSTLDGYFGDRDGAIGIQYDSSESAGSGKYRIWIRANGGWYKAESY